MFLQEGGGVRRTLLRRCLKKSVKAYIENSANALQRKPLSIRDLRILFLVSLL
ncbi:hypothetical protein ELAC_2256 [Estrella lausannensis]|uniref:Uncharacterized protein n=1 Tax=Estrella lausannensis TaxID=483423 RepID=A0A0H5DS88_9BACT|nr:hypothetical protein ELAC_2256 [Estrella lausannensis]